MEQYNTNAKQLHIRKSPYYEKFKSRYESYEVYCKNCNLVIDDIDDMGFGLSISDILKNKLYKYDKCRDCIIDKIKTHDYEIKKINELTEDVYTGHDEVNRLYLSLIHI